LRQQWVAITVGGPERGYTIGLQDSAGGRLVEEDKLEVHGVLLGVVLFLELNGVSSLTRRMSFLSLVRSGWWFDRIKLRDERH
jgi:hypothetical protein